MIVQSLVNTTGGRLCAPACRYSAAHSTATRFGAVDSNRSPGSRAGQANGQTHNHRHWCSVTEKDRKQRSSSAEFDWAAVTNVSRVKSNHSAELPTGINKNADSHSGLKLGLSGPRFGLAVVIIMDNRRLTTDEKNYIKR